MASTTAAAHAPSAGVRVAPKRRPAAAVVAAHGGSAATTLARLLGLPEAASAAAPCGLLVVAARGNLHGAQSLEAMLPSAASPVLVVITADAPYRPPAAIGAALRLHAARIEAVHHLPYVPCWRAVPATAANASRAWRNAAAALQSDVSSRSATPGRNR